MGDRSATYQEPRGLAEKLALASWIEGARGVEPVYPFDFQGVNPETFKQLLAGNGLTVSSVNVNTKSEPEFHLGALTSNELMMEVMRWPEPPIWLPCWRDFDSLA